MTMLPMTRGCPYTSPSSPVEVHAWRNPCALGPSTVTPGRAASCPHVVQADAAPDEDEEDDDDGDVLVDSELGDDVDSAVGVL
jgi:hypothetical protein